MTDSRFERVSETVRKEMDRLPIPGVAVGVLYEGQEHSAGFGVTSVENPLPVTPNTLYQVGSISKTYLGTLIMRLVAMGKVDLNTPLKKYLPDLKLQDAQATNEATLFHCLTHTGGWLGDYFDDFGRSDDALAKIVVAMGQLPQETPLGTMWSYNNAGFYLAGRVIEVVTGKTFEAAMQELIFDPLELHNSFYFAEDVISRAFVVGHETVEDKAAVARPWALSRSAHPAGGIVCNLPDLFRYARFQMGDGTLPNGTRLLSAESLRDMQTPRLRATDPESVGLTWYMRTVNGATLLRHSGGTNGQSTILNIAPSLKFAFAILTNADIGGTIINSVTASILEQFLGIAPTATAAIETSRAQLEPYVGKYRAAMNDVEITSGENGLVFQVLNKGGFPSQGSPPPATQPPPVRGEFYGPDKVILRDDPYKDMRCEFLRGANGEIAWLRRAGRIHQRLN